MTIGVVLFEGGTELVGRSGGDQEAGGQWPAGRSQLGQGVAGVKGQVGAPQVLSHKTNVIRTHQLAVSQLPA